MVLPRIPRSTVQAVDNIIKEYLWGKGRKAKIAYKILQNPKREGGLNLVCLERKDMALKATWPQILFTERDYSLIVYNIMRCDSIQEDIWRCNLAQEHVKQLKIGCEFWEQVLEGWCKYNYVYKNREDNQMIWYNSEILIGSKIFFWRDVYMKGLKFVHQLFCDREFKTHEQVWDEFGLTKLRYNSLKMAIPKYLKVYFTTNGKGIFLST